MPGTSEDDAQGSRAVASDLSHAAGLIGQPVESLKNETANGSTPIVRFILVRNGLKLVEHVVEVLTADAVEDEIRRVQFGP